jgi:hypothetical protein
MEVSGQLHVPAALPPGKEPRYPVDREIKVATMIKEIQNFGGETSFNTVT